MLFTVEIRDRCKIGYDLEALISRVPARIAYHILQPMRTACTVAANYQLVTPTRLSHQLQLIFGYRTIQARNQDTYSTAAASLALFGRFVPASCIETLTLADAMCDPGNRAER